MNFFKRLRYSIEADVTSLLEKKERKNPISLLNHYLRQAEAQTKETASCLQRQQQLKEQFELQLQENAKMLAKRQEQLALVEASGDVDLLSFAQQEVATYTARANMLEQSLQQASTDYFELEQKYEQMKHKLKDMKVRQLQLMGKENVVRAHHKMNTVLQKQVAGDDSFAEMENYIDSLSDRIEADYSVTTFEQRLDQLAKQQANDVLLTK